MKTPPLRPSKVFLLQLLETIEHMRTGGSTRSYINLCFDQAQSSQEWQWIKQTNGALGGHPLPSMHEWLAYLSRCALEELERPDEE